MSVSAKLGKAVKNPRMAKRLALQAMLFRPRLNAALTRFGGAETAAWLAALTIDDSDYARGQPTILVLDRLYFEKDVVELRRRGRFNYLTLNTHVLSVTQSSWLPEPLREQIFYAPRSTGEHAEAWLTAEVYAAQILAIAQRRWGIDAVLASNVDYWQHECFRRACRKADIPFLVLCQEQQTVPFTYAISVDLYRNADFHYTGTGVAVFEGRTRDMLIESGCCTAEQVAVTGAPRLDPWFDKSIPERDADGITLLTFDGDQYFAPGCYLDALREFAAASARHADGPLRFVLKCKDHEDEVRARAHLIGVRHNLVVTHTARLTDLFPRSRLIVGYNSLALLEGLLSPAELAVPQWGDAARPVEEQNVDPNDETCRGHFRFIEGPAAMARLLDEAVRTPRPSTDMDSRRKLLRRWFYLPKSGSASLALEAYITRVLVAKKEAWPASVIPSSPGQ